MDEYIEDSVKFELSSILQELSLQQIKMDIRFSWYGKEKGFVALQHLAHYAGLAYYDRKIYLNFHKVYGPWISLRASIILDLEGPPDESQPTLEHPFPQIEEKLEKKWNEITQNSNELVFDRNHQWKKWVELRKVAGKYVDPQFVFSEDQIRYHYTTDIQILKNLIKE